MKWIVHVFSNETFTVTWIRLIFIFDDLYLFVNFSFFFFLFTELETGRNCNIYLRDGKKLIIVHNVRPTSPGKKKKEEKKGNPVVCFRNASPIHETRVFPTSTLGSLPSIIEYRIGKKKKEKKNALFLEENAFAFERSKRFPNCIAISQSGINIYFYYTATSFSLFLPKPSFQTSLPR